MDIYEEIIKARNEGRAYALATIVNTVGCGPRSPGTKMLVFQDGSILGTVGGAHTEQLVIKDALDCIRSGRTLLKTYSPKTLKEAAMDVDCAKTIEVFIEPGNSVPHLYLLGGGHVARAVIPLAKQIGFHVTVMDTRDLGTVKESLSDADEIVRLESYGSIGPEMVAPQGYYIVCTSGHASDEEALRAVLPLNAAYIGMLGAKHKFVPLFRRLVEAGYSEEELKEIYAPIGLSTGGESLPEIGISIAAELMAVRYGRPGGHLRDLRRADIFPL